MFAYDMTFDPKVFLGHFDLILWFNDFALFLNSQLVFSYFFQIINESDPTFYLNVIIGHYDLISCVTNSRTKPQQTPSVEKHAYPLRVIYCAIYPTLARFTKSRV